MRKKQRYRRVSFEEAVSIVRRWHSGESTQPELAREFGIDPGHINRLCHGASRPEVYEAVRREFESAQETE